MLVASRSGCGNRERMQCRTLKLSAYTNSPARRMVGHLRTRFAMRCGLRAAPGVLRGSNGSRARARRSVDGQHEAVGVRERFRITVCGGKYEEQGVASPDGLVPEGDILTGLASDELVGAH
jgi:hypothetical protein